MINAWKAKILQFMVAAGGPVTETMLMKQFGAGYDTIHRNLERMIVANEIEKKKFDKINNLDPSDYRLSTGAGRTPKQYFAITPKGMSKYGYYQDKGVYEGKNIEKHTRIVERQKNMI